MNDPGHYKIGKSPPESAVGLAPDGTLYVVYVRLGRRTMPCWNGA